MANCEEKHCLDNSTQAELLKSRTTRNNCAFKAINYDPVADKEILKDIGGKLHCQFSRLRNYCNFSLQYEPTVDANVQKCTRLSSPELDTKIAQKCSDEVWLKYERMYKKKNITTLRRRLFCSEMTQDLFQLYFKLCYSKTTKKPIPKALAMVITRKKDKGPKVSFAHPLDIELHRIKGEERRMDCVENALKDAVVKETNPGS